MIAELQRATVLRDDACHSIRCATRNVGMNLQRAVIPVLPKDQLDAMYEDGAISDIAMIGPFGHHALGDISPGQADAVGQHRGPGPSRRR